MDSNVTVDSCSSEEFGIKLKIKTVLPQPFVWFETSFVNGQWNKNNILLLKDITEVKWETAETISCEEFTKSIRVFYPSKVRGSRN